MGDLWVQLVPRVDGEWPTLPADVAAKMRTERLHLQGGQSDLAVRHFRESVRWDPTVAAAHYNLGFALTARRRDVEAITAFQRATAFDPQHADAENNVGALLHAAGRVDEAEPHYRRALALRPENAEAYDNIGRILSARGQRSEAVAHFRTALELRPDWARPMIGLAWLFGTMRGAPADVVAEAVRLGERAAVLTSQGDSLAHRRARGGLRFRWPIRSSRGDGATCHPRGDARTTGIVCYRDPGTAGLVRGATPFPSGVSA